MRIGNIEVKRRVWIGLIFALTVTIGWWEWNRAKPPAVAIVTPPRQPSVRVGAVGPGGGDQIMQEKAQLFDPTPLFFPTEWNFGQRPLPEAMRRQPGQVFSSFPANTDFGDQNIKAYGAEASTVADKFVEVLAQGNEVPLAGMGQIDVQHAALAERTGFMEVRGLADGKVIMSQALNGLTLPRVDFDPLEFLVAVSSAGIVGEPVSVHWSSSDSVAAGGSEEVEAFFRSYLVKTFRLGERLQPGRYRVLVGP